MFAIRKLFFKWFVLPFMEDGFIKPENLRREIDYLTMRLASHYPEDDDKRDSLIREREHLLLVWDSYKIRHKNHRNKWKKKMLDNFR